MNKFNIRVLKLLVLVLWRRTYPDKLNSRTGDNGGYLDNVNIQLGMWIQNVLFKLFNYETGLGHSGNAPASVIPGSILKCILLFKPGEHQPSGSCNFSRIDNARLDDLSLRLWQSRCGPYTNILICYEL